MSSSDVSEAAQHLSKINRTSGSTRREKQEYSLLHRSVVVVVGGAVPLDAGGVPSCLTCGLPPGHLSVTVRQWLVLRIRSFPELEPTSGVFAPKMVCGIKPQKIGVAEEEELAAKAAAAEQAARKKAEDELATAVAAEKAAAEEAVVAVFLALPQFS